MCFARSTGGSNPSLSAILEDDTMSQQTLEEVQRQLAQTCNDPDQVMVCDTFLFCLQCGKHVYLDFGDGDTCKCEWVKEYEANRANRFRKQVKQPVKSENRLNDL